MRELALCAMLSTAGQQPHFVRWARSGMYMVETLSGVQDASLRSFCKTLTLLLSSVVLL